MIKETRRRRNFIIVAHRGFSGLYPENTLLSFRKAVEVGADFVELDVNQTKDDILVVIHDSTVDRTTNGKGKVEQLTYEEIKQLDAGAWKGFPGETIPSLEEVLLEIAGKAKIFIEIKKCDVEKLVEMIRKLKVEEEVIVGSFDIEYVKKIRRLAPEVTTSLITSEIPRDLRPLLRYGIQQLSVYFRSLNREVVKRLFSHGLTVNVWTPNTDEELEYALSLDVQSVTTDFPLKLRQFLPSY